MQASWVASDLLPKKEQAYVKTGHPLYNVYKSKTARLMSGETFETGYGDGSGSSGPVYRETVTIGGMKINNLRIGVANSLHLGSVDEDDQSRNTDGTLGLGFKKLNTARPTRQLNFMENLIAADFPQPLFTTHT